MLKKNFKLMKIQKGRLRQNLYNHEKLFIRYGNFGIKAKEAGRITPKQFESVRRFLVRKLGRTSIICFYLFPDFSLTKKPLEVRMGKGKGNISFWVARCSSGNILVDILTPITQETYENIQKVRKKFPVKTKNIVNFSDNNSLKSL